jgi:hypothetical protein
MRIFIFLRENDKLILVIMCVDDLFITRNHTTRVNQIKSKLLNQFGMTILGMDSKYFSLELG